MDGPDSSYSSLDTHICWKVERDAMIEPPIQPMYLRSGGAITWLQRKERRTANAAVAMLWVGGEVIC